MKNIFKKNYITSDAIQMQTNYIFLDENWFELQSKRHILEVGCGAGKIAKYLTDKLPETVLDARDISPELIESNIKNYGYSNRLKFSVQDMMEMQDKKKFDCVISFFCFHWIPTEKQLCTLRQFINALKLGGLLLLIIPIESKSFLLARQQIIASDKWKENFGDFMPKGIVDNAEHYHGLLNQLQNKVGNYHVLIQHSYSKNDTIMMSFDEFAQFYSGWAPEINLGFLKSEDEKQEFMRDVANLLPCNDAGNIKLDFFIFYNSTLSLNLTNSFFKRPLQRSSSENTIIERSGIKGPLKNSF